MLRYLEGRSAGLAQVEFIELVEIVSGAFLVNEDKAVLSTSYG